MSLDPDPLTIEPDECCVGPWPCQCGGSACCDDYPTRPGITVPLLLGIVVVAVFVVVVWRVWG